MPLWGRSRPKKEYVDNGLTWILLYTVIVLISIVAINELIHATPPKFLEDLLKIQELGGSW